MGHAEKGLDLLAGWLGNLDQHRSLVVWRTVPRCVMWCLWREWNTHHFEDCEKTIPVLKLLFSKIYMIGLWGWAYFLFTPLRS